MRPGCKALLCSNVGAAGTHDDSQASTTKLKSAPCGKGREEERNLACSSVKFLLRRPLRSHTTYLAHDKHLTSSNMKPAALPLFGHRLPQKAE